MKTRHTWVNTHSARSLIFILLQVSKYMWYGVNIGLELKTGTVNTQCNSITLNSPFLQRLRGFDIIYPSQKTSMYISSSLAMIYQ